MSDKSVLEQVLEHLLAEDDAQAKDLLHSFMVEKSITLFCERSYFLLFYLLKILDCLYVCIIQRSPFYVFFYN